MRKLLVAVGICAAAVAALAGTAGAEPTLKVQSVDTSTSPRIHLTVQVPAELVGTSLPDEAFSVTEAGRSRPVHVAQLPNSSLSLVLAIDSSGSMRGEALEAAKAAAINFARQMPAGTRIAVVGFGDTPYLVSGFTTDANALSDAINGLRATGETSLYDAVLASVSQLGTETTQRHDVVLLTDGKDTRSAASLAAAADAIRGANITIYPVGLVTGESDVGALNDLGAASGQQAAPATDPGALQGIYNAIALQIASQYELSFRARGTGPTPVIVSVDWNNVQASAPVTVDIPTPPVTNPPRPASASPQPASDPLLAQDWALAVGGVLVFVALCLALLPLLQGRKARTVLEEERAELQTHEPSHLTEIVGRASQLADRTLEQHNKRRALNDALERAGIDMRPGEFSVLVVGSAFGALFVGLVLGSPLVGLVLAALTVVVFRAVVAIKERRRRAQFAEQLGDTLQLLASNLRTGHGLLQSIDTVAEESESPTREEFRRIVIETRLGQDLSHALEAAAARVGNEDFDWVVQAIDIHREVGGDLAEILDNVGDTIRDRNTIRRQVQALTAEGRLSAVILFLLPIGLAVVIGIVSPTYIDELLDSTAGNIMIGLGVILMALGGLWLHRLTRLVF
jgi:tight adherence protein B